MKKKEPNQEIWLKNDIKDLLDKTWNNLTSS